MTKFVLSKGINWNGDLKQADLLHAIIPWYRPRLVPVSEMFSHYWCLYHLSGPLRSIVLCYRSCLVPVSDMSFHYRCRYLMLDPLCAIVPFLFLFLKFTITADVVISCCIHSMISSRSLYRKPHISYSNQMIVSSSVILLIFSYTSTIFNGVYTKQSKVD